MSQSEEDTGGAWGSEACHRGIGIHGTLYHKEHPDTVTRGWKINITASRVWRLSTHYQGSATASQRARQRQAFVKDAADTRITKRKTHVYEYFSSLHTGARLSVKDASPTLTMHETHLNETDKHRSVTINLKQVMKCAEDNKWFCWFFFNSLMTIPFL